MLRALANEWRDAFNLALSTPRAALAGPVAQLQRVRRDAQALTLPSCAAPVRDTLVAAMNPGVDGFLALLSFNPNQDKTDPRIPGGVATYNQIASVVSRELADEVFLGESRASIESSTRLFTAFTSELTRLTP